jgi:hypothetical protein
VCSGSVAQLSVTASSATAYQWKKNGVDVTDGSGGNTANYTTAPLTENATYTVVVMNGTSACSATSSDILVTVNTVPVITRSGGEASQTVKQDSAITTIVYSAPNSNFTLSGSLPAGVDGIASSNSYTISGTPTAPGPGTYNYTVTATSPGGCTATSSGSITVKL